MRILTPFQRSDTYNRVIVLKNQIFTQVPKILNIDSKLDIISCFVGKFTGIFVVKPVERNFKPFI